MLIYDEISTKRKDFRIDVYLDGRRMGRILREGNHYYYQCENSRERGEAYGSLHTLKWELEG